MTQVYDSEEQDNVVPMRLEFLSVLGRLRDFDAIFEGPTLAVATGRGPDVAALVVVGTDAVRSTRPRPRQRSRAERPAG